MMLTILGLPARAKYQDVKSMIVRQCNIQDFILDNLARDGGSMRVRIGLTNDREGAHVIKCLNGFRMAGNVLTVIPVGNAPVSSQSPGNFDQRFPPRNEYLNQGGSNFGNRPVDPIARSDPLGRDPMGRGTMAHPDPVPRQEMWTTGNNQWSSPMANQVPQGSFVNFQQTVPGSNASFGQQSALQSQRPAVRPFEQRDSFPQSRIPPQDQYGFPHKNDMADSGRRGEPRPAGRSVLVVGEPLPPPQAHFAHDYTAHKPMTIMKDNFQGPQYNLNRPTGSQGGFQGPQAHHEQPPVWSQPNVPEKSQPFPKGPTIDKPYDRKYPEQNLDKRQMLAKNIPEGRDGYNKDYEKGPRFSPRRDQRHLSPNDRRMSPGRRGSPSERRVPPRRESPTRRLVSPVRREPAHPASRYSPSRLHDKPADKYKEVRPAYEPSGQAPNQAMYSGGYRPSVHGNAHYAVSGNRQDQRDPVWQDSRFKKDDDRRDVPRMPKFEPRIEQRVLNADMEKRSPRRSRSPMRRERSPHRDRFKKHSASPARSPRRSWALEKRRSPEVREAPPPPSWPGQKARDGDDFRSRPGFPDGNKKREPVWERPAFDEKDDRHNRRPGFEDKRFSDEMRPRPDLEPRGDVARISHHEPSPRGMKFDDRLPHREHKFEPRDLKFESRGPKFEPRDPNFEHRTPKFETRDPKFEPREPKFEPREPKFEPREPKFESREPKFEPRESKFEPREPKFEPREPKFEPREPKFEPREPKFEPREPKFEPREPKFEPREPKFEPRQTRFEPRQTRFEPRQTRFEPRQTRFEPSEPKFEPREPKFEPREPKFEPREPKFEPREEFPRHNEYRGPDLDTKKPYDRGDYRDVERDERHRGPVAHVARREEDKYSRRDGDWGQKETKEFEKEFEIIYERAVEFNKRVDALQKSGDRRKDDNEDRRLEIDRREPDFERKRVREGEHDRLHFADHRRAEDYANRERGRPDDRDRRTNSPAIKAKREKAVEEIAQKLIHKYGSDVHPEIKQHILEELRVNLNAIVKEMFGKEDVSFIEMVVKFNSRFDGQQERKIFNDVMANIPSHYRGLKRPHEEPVRTEIPEKNTKHAPTSTLDSRHRSSVKRAYIRPELPRRRYPPSMQGQLLKPTLKTQRPTHKPVFKPRPRTELKPDLKAFDVAPKEQRTLKRDFRRTAPKVLQEDSDIANVKGTPQASTEVRNKASPKVKEADRPRAEATPASRHEISPVLARVLDSELQKIMIKVWQELPDEPPSEAEKLVADKFRNQVGDDLKNILGLNVTKRLLNVFNPLYVRAEFNREPSNKHIQMFVSKYNCSVMKRLRSRQHMYVAQLRSVREFDRVCSAKVIECGNLIVKVTPCYKFTQGPSTLKTTYNIGTSNKQIAEKDESKTNEQMDAKNTKIETINPENKVTESKITEKHTENKEIDSKPAANTIKKIAQSKDTANKVADSKTGELKVVANADANIAVKQTGKVTDNAKESKCSATPVAKANVNTNTKTETVTNTILDSIPIKAAKTPDSKNSNEKINDPKTNVNKDVESKDKTSKIPESTTTKEIDTVKVNTGNLKNVVKSNNSTGTNKSGATKVQSAIKPKVLVKGNFTEKQKLDGNAKRKGLTKESLKTNKLNVRKRGTKLSEKRGRKFDASKYDDFDEVNDEDILALISNGIVLDECSGSDDD